MLIFRVVILRLSVLSTFVPFKILSFLPFSKREWESLFTLQCLYYPFLVFMFYVNMHIVSCGGSFWVTMFGQSFQIIYLSVRCVLDMRQLDACLHFILPSRGSVSHSWRASFDSSFVIWCSSLASCIYSSSCLLQASLDSCYFPYIFFLYFIPLYQDSLIDCSFHSCHHLRTTIRYQDHIIHY